MTLQKLASEIAKREGKKSQARIGDIREILRLICVIDAEQCFHDPETDGALVALTEGTNRELRNLRRKKAK